jgi:hypothetical protein
MDWLLTFADPTIDWNYAMVTLVVRFIGVFVVMFVMQVALQVSSYAVQRVESRGAETAAAGGVAVPPPVVKAGEPAEPTPAVSDEATAAAIGLALALEMRAAASTAAGAAPSSWAVAGRLTQLNRLPR